MASSLSRAVTLHQISIDASQALRLRPDAAAGAVLWIPRVQVDVQPPGRIAHEALQEQRAEYGAGKARCRDIVQIRNLARKFILVARPERHRPQRVMFDGADSRELLHDG